MKTRLEIPNSQSGTTAKTADAPRLLRRSVKERGRKAASKMRQIALENDPRRRFRCINHGFQTSRRATFFEMTECLKRIDVAAGL